MAEALDIGLEIKILRERMKMSSKDLAARIGLSQSQMSRLEKGQRRIDTTILHKIASALGVEPSFFFREAASEAETPAGSLDAPLKPRLHFDQLGKLVRSERRKKHLSSDDLAARTGKTRAFIEALEEGRHGLDAELAHKLTRALKLPTNFFIEAQAEMLRALEAQVSRLDRALAEAHRGKISADPEAGGDRQSIPLLGPLIEGRSFLFDGNGQPLGEAEDFLHVPGFHDGEAFAFTIGGDAMDSGSSPSYREGDLVVFSPGTIPRSRDLALVRIAGGDTLLFRKLFFEPDGSVRLQPLNLDHAARTLPRSGIAAFWSVALHISRS